MSLFLGEPRAGHKIADKSHSPTVNERARISSLDLMIVCVLVHPGGYCPSLLSYTQHPSEIPGSCFKVALQLVDPILYWCRELTCARGKNFGFLNFMRFLQTHICSLLKFLWMAAQPSCVSDTSSQFCIICKFTKVVPCLSFLVIKEEVKQYCLTINKLWGTLLVTGFQLKCFCSSQLFETGCSASFQHTLLFIYLIHTSSVCV